MRFRSILLLLTLCASDLWAQKSPSVQMYQPHALLSAYDAEQLVAVEFGERETRIVTHALGWEIPAATYVSDEADRRYPLSRIENQDTDWVLVFEALPQTTRLLDVIFEGTPRRWMGIHSGVRALQFPSVRPRFDENATVPDSIQTILRANNLADLLSSDSLYSAVSRQLPLFRDYIVWKYKLTAHQVFLLQRSLSPTRTTHDSSRDGGEGLRAASYQAGGRASIAGGDGKGSRTLPRAPKPTRRELRRLSRFEQKMLQEQRHPEP